MILYYSGTGNSRYIARRIAAITGDELLNITEHLRSGDHSPIDCGGRAVFVTPTYAWRVPRLVMDWIEKTAFTSADKAWFVMSCGSETGNAAKYNKELCDRKGFGYMGTAQIVMPENYIAMFSAPDEEEARRIILKAEPFIDRAAGHIGGGEGFPEPRCNLYDRLVSSVVNKPFYSLCVNSKAFKADERCISCGRCVSLCPTNSITLKDGKPVWGDGCTHCMACICHCPAEAIEYGRRSLGKPRYHLD